MKVYAEITVECQFCARGTIYTVEKVGDETSSFCTSCGDYRSVSKIEKREYVRALKKEIERVEAELAL